MKHFFFINAIIGLLFISPFISNAQFITTFAGNGIGGNTGNGGPATAAELDDPAGISIDNSGNVYFTDINCNCIRKINTSGIISAVGGNGIAGFSGDGGLATDASFNNPRSIAIDRVGNIYISDYLNSCIRKIDTAGIVNTFAGIGLNPGLSGDGGLATAAKISLPEAVAVDGNGNVYIADVHNNDVRKVSGGIITTIAGTGVGGHSGDGGPATNAMLHNPISIAIDNSDNVYIGDSLSYLRKVDTFGNINTIAGYGPYGYFGDGGPATSARFNSIYGIATDNRGNIFLSDQGNSVIRVINASGIVSNYVGNHIQGFGGDGGAAVFAELNDPWGIVIDSTGILYIADVFNARIRKVTTPTTIKTINETNYALQIYPNPSAGIFAVNLPQTNQSKTIVIRDILGKELTIRTVLGNDLQLFDLSNITGAYLVEVICGGNVYCEKVMIE